MEYHPAHTPLSLSKSNSVELLYNTRWATPTPAHPPAEERKSGLTCYLF